MLISKLRSTHLKYLFFVICASCFYLTIFGCVSRESNLSPAQPMSQSKQNESVRMLNNKAVQLEEQGRLQEAREKYKQALKIAKETKDLYGEGITLNNFGFHYYSLGQYSNALDFYHQAVAIEERQGNHFSTSTIFYAIGDSYLKLNQYQNALVAYEKALVASLKLGDNDKQGKVIRVTILGKIGDIYYTQKEYPKSLKAYQQAMEVSQQLSSNEMKIEIHRKLEAVQQAMKK